MRPIDELILVYNADSGLVAALVDSARKMLTLQGCMLCATPHEVAGERQERKTTFGVSPDSLRRCNGKVAGLKGRLRHNATLKGLSLPMARGQIGGAYSSAAAMREWARVMKAS